MMAMVSVLGPPSAATAGRASERTFELLADVRRGTWKPPMPDPVPEPHSDPSFHVFASEYVAGRASELRPRSLESLKWALSYHLLPYFKDYRLRQITAQEVDKYKTFKLDEGVLSPNSVNKTLARLSEILALATEYDLLPANPAAGKRRRVHGTKPRRPSVEPFQLPALLEAAEPLHAKRGRPLLSVLGGAGLRIGEALSIRRQDINRGRGTLAVVDSKTAAGVRVVDLTPSVLAELEAMVAKIPEDPHALVFGTASAASTRRP